MNSVLSALLLFSVLFHSDPRLSVGFSLTPNQPTQKDKELSCELSLPSEVWLVGGYFEASLVITNIHDHSVRICTLTQGWRSIGTTEYEEVRRPDFWKSDRPTQGEFPKHIVTIESAASISIP